MWFSLRSSVVIAWNFMYWDFVCFVESREHAIHQLINWTEVYLCKILHSQCEIWNTKWELIRFMQYYTGLYSVENVWSFFQGCWKMKKKNKTHGKSSIYAQYLYWKQISQQLYWFVLLMFRSISIKLFHHLHT